MLGTFLRRIVGVRAVSAAASSRRLHLCCGRDIRDGWINLDAQRLPGVTVVADLDACAEQPLPLADNSIDEFFGSHVLEHLSYPLPFMQELHRIASPDAKLVFHVPYGSSDDADEDPTHVRRYFVNSFHYFSQLAYSKADYGYRGDWQTEGIVLTVAAERYANTSNDELIEQVQSRRNVVIEMIATLRAIKPVRVPGKTTIPKLHISIKRVPGLRSE